MRAFVKWQGHDQRAWGNRDGHRKHKLIRRSFFCATFVADKQGPVEKGVCKLMILKWDGLM